jgi:RNA polymerase subunit RPABC4/transcription elongation factor Spt4
MPFCPNCGKEISEDTRFCPKCGEGLVRKNALGLQTLAKIQDEMEEAKHKENIHGILGLAFIIVGIIGGIMLFLLLNPAAFLGIVLFIIGIGFVSSAIRYERKAKNLKKLIIEYKQRNASNV